MKDNPAKKLAWVTARKKHIKRATPKWLTKSDKAFIVELYKIAKELTEQTGIAHHVDHIIPLRGKLVCGLHVPDNLQVLPAPENLSKHNKFTP